MTMSSTQETMKEWKFPKRKETPTELNGPLFCLPHHGLRFSVLSPCDSYRWKQGLKVRGWPDLHLTVINYLATCMSFPLRSWEQHVWDIAVYFLAVLILPCLDRLNFRQFSNHKRYELLKRKDYANHPDLTVLVNFNVPECAVVRHFTVAQPLFLYKGWTWPGSHEKKNVVDFQYIWTFFHKTFYQHMQTIPSLTFPGAVK